MLLTRRLHSLLYTTVTVGCRIKLTEKKTPFFRIGTTRLRVAGVQRGTGHTQGLVLRTDSSHEAERGHTRELHTQGQVTRGEWYYNLFLGKLEEKLARKARVNTERVYPKVLISPPPQPPPLGIP